MLHYSYYYQAETVKVKAVRSLAFIPSLLVHILCVWIIDHAAGFYKLWEGGVLPQLFANGNVALF